MGIIHSFIHILRPSAIDDDRDNDSKKYLSNDTPNSVNDCKVIDKSVDNKINESMIKNVQEDGQQTLEQIRQIISDLLKDKDVTDGDYYNLKKIEEYINRIRESTIIEDEDEVECVNV